jgi:hypothetical protein
MDYSHIFFSYQALTYPYFHYCISNFSCGETALQNILGEPKSGIKARLVIIVELIIMMIFFLIILLIGWEKKEEKT